MNHRPFEDWLLEGQSLTQNQKRELQVHLQTCLKCTALAEVDLALRSAKAAIPAAGFAARFQVRLATQKKEARKRQFWGFFILVLAVLSLLIWLAWPLFETLVDSPAELLSTWLSSLVSLWVFIQALGEAGRVLLNVIPGFIPSYVWTLAAFVLAGWSLVWVVSILKFTKIPQGV